MYSKILSKKYFSSKAHVTFIGLGNMGYKMGSNLLKSGKFSVSGFDLVKDVQEKFSSQEGAVALSLPDSVKKSQYIMTMLDKTATVGKIWDEILSSKPQQGAVLIDSSTISYSDSKEFSINAQKHGVLAYDAPVSGGIYGAANASLTFMVGSDNKENFEKAQEFLNYMGKKIIHCGDHGAGQIFKMCNNLVLGITNAGLSESLSLGKQLGVDINLMCEVLANSTATCWPLNVNCVVPGVKPDSPSSKDYQGGFSNELIEKDMKLAIENSNKIKGDLKLGKIAHKYYDNIIREGDGKKDFGILYKYKLDNKL